MRAVRENGTFGMSRSCQLGGRDRSRQRCHKCYRKQLIISALDRSPLPPWATQNAGSDNPRIEIVRKGPPFPMHSIYAYSLSRIEGLEGTIYEETANAIGATEEGTRWVSGYYEPAVLDLASRWREIVAPKLARFSRFMTTDERAQMESFDANKGIGVR